MTGQREADSRDYFLDRIGREAGAWSLRALPLPGGLVLLEEGLSRLERQRFLLLLGNRIGPPSPAPIPDEADLDHDGTTGPTTESSVEMVMLDPEACQVTVEERQHLFGCFRLEP